MPEITRLGHVGVYCREPQKMKEFYTSIMGLTVKDEIPARGVVFLTANPNREHHELALFGVKEGEPTTEHIQQISFKVDTVDEVREFYRRIRDNDVPIDSTVTHGFAISLYFFDPEGNRLEIYYSTPFNVSPPVNVPIDLEQSTEELLALAGSFATGKAEAAPQPAD